MPVVNATTPASASGIHKVVIISKLTKYDKLRKAMNDLGVTGMTVTQVMGCGIQKGRTYTIGIHKCFALTAA